MESFLRTATAHPGDRAVSHLAKSCCDSLARQSALSVEHPANENTKTASTTVRVPSRFGRLPSKGAVRAVSDVEVGCGEPIGRVYADLSDKVPCRRAASPAPPADEGPPWSRSVYLHWLEGAANGFGAGKPPSLRLAQKRRTRRALPCIPRRLY